MLVEDPEGIKQIMKDCKTIAIVGFSDDPGKAGYFVADYLKSVGYRIIPVNPNLKWGLKENRLRGLSGLGKPLVFLDVPAYGSARRAGRRLEPEH